MAHSSLNFNGCNLKVLKSTDLKLVKLRQFSANIFYEIVQELIVIFLSKVLKSLNKGVDGKFEPNINLLAELV